MASRTGPAAENPRRPRRPPPDGVHWLRRDAMGQLECRRCPIRDPGPHRFAKIAYGPCPGGPKPEWEKVVHEVHDDLTFGAVCLRCGGRTDVAEAARLVRTTCPVRRLVGEEPRDWGLALWVLSGQRAAGQDAEGRSRTPKRRGGKARVATVRGPGHVVRDLTNLGFPPGAHVLVAGAGLRCCLLCGDAEGGGRRRGPANLEATRCPGPGAAMAQGLRGALEAGALTAAAQAAGPLVFAAFEARWVQAAGRPREPD